MTETPATLTEALIQLQAHLPRITKTATGQHGKYADLNVITDAVSPLLTSYGLLWICLPTIRLDGRFALHYHMLHAATGETGLEGWYPLDATSPQGRGAEITYARRYALCAALNIAPAGDDDDGQAAESEWRPPANPRARKREYRHSPDPHDQWAHEPEKAPGSSTGPQHNRLAVLFSMLGITEPKDRLALSMSILDLPELESSKTLSFADAEKLARNLEARIKEREAKPDA